MTDRMQRTIREHRQKLDWLSRQLKHPGKRLEEHAQRLDELELRLRQSIKRSLQLNQSKLQTAGARLQNRNPSTRIQSLQKDVTNLRIRLRRSFQQDMVSRHTDLRHFALRLNTVSPLATLSRGYSITKAQDGSILREAGQAAVGDSIRTQLHQGALTCTVIDVESGQ